MQDTVVLRGIDEPGKVLLADRHQRVAVAVKGSVRGFPTLGIVPLGIGPPAFSGIPVARRKFGGSEWW